MLNYIVYALANKPFDSAEASSDDVIVKASHLIRQKEYKQAITLLEGNDSFYAILLTAKAEFQLGNFKVTGDLVSKKAVQKIPEGPEKQECERWCTALLNKSLIEVTGVSHAGNNINSLAVIQSIKPAKAAQVEETK